MLLNLTDSWGPDIGLFVGGILLVAIGVVSLFVLSIVHLVKRRWKRGLIELGIVLLVLGLVALLIYA